jgi:acetolactate synthase I/II/III large subunit
MSRPFRRGADALVQALQAAGVRRLFTLSGNHVMPVFDAALDAGIELLHVRHEAAAVHMADAWARLTGQVGVALVTGGPGHANAVGALYTAAMAESPLLLLSGHAPLAQRGQGAFQEMRQAEIAAPLCKAAWTVDGADALGPDLARAWRLARTGRPGPVQLSLPVDGLEAACGAAPPTPADFQPPLQALAPEAARAVVERLASAQRPLVLAGPGLSSRAGRERLAALAAALGVPALVMESPRGIADPALGGFAQRLAQADTVLLLGKPLDFTLQFGRPPAWDPGCAVLQVDPEPAEIERARRALGPRLLDAHVADTAAALEALIAAAQAPHAGRAWAAEVHAAIAWRPPAWDRPPGLPDRLHPVQALRPLQALLDRHPDAVLVCDGGEIGQWAQACLSAPQRVINGVAGSIGAALPFALAARLAVPDAPVIAVMGDGTFGFHCAEIDTALRHRLPFLAVVGNDARWNAEHQIQLRDYGRTVGCELLPTRYDAVCAAFGGHGELVRQPSELLPAAERALASGLPACLNVVIEGLPAPSLRRPA